MINVAPTTEDQGTHRYLETSGEPFHEARTYKLGIKRLHRQKYLSAK